MGHGASREVGLAVLDRGSLPLRKLGDSPANLLINQGVMATLQERRLGYHSRAGLEPGTSGFSTLRINHYAARGMRIPDLRLGRPSTWTTLYIEGRSLCLPVYPGQRDREGPLSRTVNTLSWALFWTLSWTLSWTEGRGFRIEA
jgi:hypothetical protein